MSEPSQTHPAKTNTATPAQVNDPFSDQQFGTAAYTQLVPKGPKYWLALLVFAIGLTALNYAWRTQWVPAKPIAWQAYSNFLARQCISLKRPILVAYLPPVNSNPLGKVSATSDDPQSSQTQTPSNNAPKTSNAQALESKLQAIDTPEIRATFHLQSSRAFRLAEVADTNDLAWLFPEGPPTVPTLLCWTPGAQMPRNLVPIEQSSPQIVFQWLVQNRKSRANDSD